MFWTRKTLSWGCFQILVPCNLQLFSCAQNICKVKPSVSGQARISKNCFKEVFPCWDNMMLVFPTTSFPTLGCWFQSRRSSRPVSMAWIRWDLSFEHRHLWNSYTPQEKLEEVGYWKKIHPFDFLKMAYGMPIQIPWTKRHWRWQKSLDEWQRILNDKVLQVIFFFYRCYLQIIGWELRS